MSKDVDLSKPLSDDDREYLLQRNRWQEVNANDVKFADAEPLEPGDGLPDTGSVRVDTVPDQPLSADEHAALRAAENSNETEDPEKTALEENSSDQSDDEDESYEGEEWHKQDLQDELDKREIAYPSAALKDELRDLLLEDDASKE